MMFYNPKVLQRSERGTFRDFNRYHLGGNMVFRAESNLGAAIRARRSSGPTARIRMGRFCLLAHSRPARAAQLASTTRAREPRTPDYSLNRDSRSAIVSRWSLVRATTTSNTTTATS